MSDETFFKERDFVPPGAGSASAVSKRAKSADRAWEAWRKREVEASAVLNPQPPYRRVAFDPGYWLRG